MANYSIKIAEECFYNNGRIILNSITNLENDVRRALNQTVAIKTVNRKPKNKPSYTGINATVGYNGTYNFTATGSVKVRYKYITSDGTTIYSEELDVERNGNNYTINNIKQDVYIEIS